MSCVTEGCGLAGAVPPSSRIARSNFHLGERPMLQAFEVLLLDFGLFLISLGLFIKFVAWMYG